jgi:hypothetical protein
MKAKENRPWIDDCTLQNADVVRDLLERHPGLVLATFSGHDHAPDPPWSKAAVDTPTYFTHHGLVEGNGARFSTDFAREDAIGSHACTLEVSTRVSNGILLGCSLSYQLTL